MALTTLNDTNIEWFDGFEEYSNAQLKRYYLFNQAGWLPGTGLQQLNVVPFDTNASLSSGNGRNGSNCLRIIAVNRGIYYTLSSAFSTITTGFAFRTSFIKNNFTILGFTSTGLLQLMLTINVNGTISIYRNGTTTPLGTTTKSLSPSIYYYIEFSVTIHNTTGAFELRVNGTTWLSASGINTRSSNISVNSANGVTIGDFSGGDNSNVDFDDWYIRNDGTFMGDLRVETKLPTGNGTTNNFTPSTGSNWQNVDENPATDDTDYNSSNVANDIDLYTYPTLSTTTGIVKAVMIQPIFKTTTAACTACVEMRQNSNNFARTTQYISANDYTSYPDIEGQDPDTTTTWTISGVNSCQFGVKRLT